MADETEEKSKQTVPALVRTPEGVAAHAAAVQDRQWDKERKVFKDPVIAMLALFTYAKLTPALLHAEAQKIVALEKRIAEFETRVTTMERWKAEAEAQTADMVKAAEEMMRNGSMPTFIEQLSAMPQDIPPQDGYPVVEAPAALAAPVVTPIKAPKKTEEKKNGGAA